LKCLNWNPPANFLYVSAFLSACCFTRPLLVQLRQAGILPTKANVFSTYLSRVKAQIGFWLWCTQQLSSFGTVPKHSIQFQFRWNMLAGKCACCTGLLTGWWCFPNACRS
jgi:hypothetical protein